MVLNADLETNNDFERQTEKKMVALNDELETSNKSEHQTKDMALNAKLKIWL